MMKAKHVRHIRPDLKLDNGKQVAGLQTESACRHAIEVYKAQIASIEHQIESDGPPALRNDPSGLANWRHKALIALDYRREILAEIRLSLELAREARTRQLASLRISRETHARKMERIELSRYETELDLQRFKEAVKAILPPEQYQKIWQQIRSEAEAGGSAE